MANMNITLCKEFNIKNITYSDVRMSDNGGKMVYLSYKKEPLILQTPPMKAPFGLSKWDNDGKNAAPKFTLDLSFGGMDNTPNIQMFYDVCESLDKRLVEDGFNHQATWFKGKKYGSTEIVEALYTPVIKYAKDKETGERTDKYAPTIKVTVPFRDGNFDCLVFDEHRNPIDLKDVETKGGRVTALLRLSGIWFAGGKFGISWRVLQMKLVPAGMGFRGACALREDDDIDVDTAAVDGEKSSSDSEEDELEADEPSIAEDLSHAFSRQSMNAPDDDDEEEDVEEDVVVEAPAKKKVYNRSKRT
jgi:hypothetical protein